MRIHDQLFRYNFLEKNIFKISLNHLVDIILKELAHDLIPLAEYQQCIPKQTGICVAMVGENRFFTQINKIILRE